MEYKISKFHWFDKIPQHWQESKISYLFDIGRGRVIAGPELKEDGLYPVYSSQTKNDGCMGMIDTYDFDDDLITWTTDGANAGTVFIRSGKFNCTNVCGTLKPGIDLNLKYYYYYLQFATQFYKRPDTNGAKIMNNEMASVHALIPPISEQSQIAAFLDRKTAQIDTIIEKKQKLLQLLDEKKKSVINEAVTGQKVWNGNAWVEAAEVKDSGEERIGKIPKDWDVSKLKYLVDVNSNVTIPSIDFKISLDNIESGTGKLKSNDSSEFEGMGNYYKPKDVLFNKLRPYLAKVYLADHYGCSVGELLVFTPNEDLNSKFLFYSILSESFINEVDSSTYGAKMPRASWSFIGNLGISFPTLSEQERIVRYLDNRISVFEMLTDKLTEQIAKLKEYRQSLISEAVTGKIDISNFN